MSPTVFDAWLKQYLADEAIRAKSLLVTILGDSVAPHGGGIWLGALIQLLDPFEVNERLVRTSVFRLTHEGWLEATRLGRRSLYTLSAAGQRRIEHADRRIYGPAERSWDGQWTMVLPDASDWTAEQRADLKRDLLWEGYAMLAPGLYGHPSDALAPLAAILEAHAMRAQVAVFQGRTAAGLSGLSDAQLVQNSWPLASLATRYEAFIERFAPFVQGGARQLDPPRAFQLCTLLVHAYRRVVLQDPQLPPTLLPANWPGHRAFIECGAIYHQAAERAEQHFREVVALPSGLDHASGAYLMRRFAQALASPTKPTPV